MKKKKKKWKTLREHKLSRTYNNKEHPYLVQAGRWWSWSRQSPARLDCLAPCRSKKVWNFKPKERKKQSRRYEANKRWSEEAVHWQFLKRSSLTTQWSTKKNRWGDRAKSLIQKTRQKKKNKEKEKGVPCRGAYASFNRIHYNVKWLGCRSLTNANWTTEKETYSMVAWLLWEKKKKKKKISSSRDISPDAARLSASCSRSELLREPSCRIQTDTEEMVHIRGCRSASDAAANACSVGEQAHSGKQYWWNASQSQSPPRSP